MEDDVLTYHLGDMAVYDKARSHGLQLIIDAVQQKVIGVPVAESLKVAVNNWAFARVAYVPREWTVAA